jgi:nitronate monooxygenase
VVLDGLAHPIVLAPMAGGPATPALAAAVSGAGGLGFLAGGYRTADALRADLLELRALGDRPFGVNLFVPGEAAVDAEALRAYLERLRARHGSALGEPRFDDDAWEAKLALLRDERVPIVSFTFGCPSSDEVASLRAAGSEVWVTVTDPDEARTAVAAGADALVVQGAEAGGHRASFVDRAGVEPLGLLPLVRLVARAVGVPLVAAGGISDGAAVAAVLAAGARAAQVGTAFLRAPEAGTTAAHRDALAADTPTALTRAFSGRTARGIVNRFLAEHSPEAPFAYPHVHHATAALRAQARARGDADGFNLWAGQAHALAVEEPAARIVERLASDAREALRLAARVLGEEPEQV